MGTSVIEKNVGGIILISTLIIKSKHCYYINTHITKISSFLLNRKLDETKMIRMQLLRDIPSKSYESNLCKIHYK